MTVPSSSSRTRPAVRLKPKADARAIRHGFPWVYDTDLVTDRRTRALEPGSLVELQDSDRAPLGLASVNPASRIMVRMLDPDPGAQLDEAWFSQRLRRAFDLRSRMFDTPFYRLVHAEADGFPGVIIDRFGDIAVIQPNAIWAEQHLELIVKSLCDVTGVKTVLKNASGRARAQEGLDDEAQLLCGSSPDGPVMVSMNSATYAADLMSGQKTGLYYDQRPNHAFAANLAKGSDVLDLFSHVGGFALAALSAGAKSALSVDASAPALELAQAGAEASNVADRFATRRGDVFDVLASLEADGARFDMVICDPPAFAPSRQALGTGLRAYEKVARMAAKLVRDDGILVLCSCSHAATLDKFRASSLRGIGRAGRQGRLIHTGFAGPDHPLHAHLAESGYLKALFFAL